MLMRQATLTGVLQPAVAVLRHQCGRFPAKKEQLVLQAMLDNCNFCALHSKAVRGCRAVCSYVEQMGCPLPEFAVRADPRAISEEEAGLPLDTGFSC